MGLILIKLKTSEPKMREFISKWFLEAEDFSLITSVLKSARDGHLFAWKLRSIETKYYLHNLVLGVANQDKVCLLSFESNIVRKCLFLVILSAWLDINSKFLKFVDGRPEVLNHDGPVESSTIVFVGVGVIFDHIHQIASPMHLPLMGIKGLFIVSELESRPVQVYFVEQACYIPKCFINLKVWHVGILAAVQIPSLSKTTLIVRAASVRPESVDSRRTQVIISLPILLTIDISIAFFRHPREHQQIVIIDGFIGALRRSGNYFYGIYGLLYLWHFFRSLIDGYYYYFLFGIILYFQLFCCLYGCYLLFNCLVGLIHIFYR